MQREKTCSQDLKDTNRSPSAYSSSVKPRWFAGLSCRSVGIPESCFRRPVFLGAKLPANLRSYPDDQASFQSAHFPRPLQHIACIGTTVGYWRSLQWSLEPKPGSHRGPGCHFPAIPAPGEAGRFFWSSGKIADTAVSPRQHQSLTLARSNGQGGDWQAPPQAPARGAR